MFSELPLEDPFSCVPTSVEMVWEDAKPAASATTTIPIIPRPDARPRFVCFPLSSGLMTNPNNINAAIYRLKSAPISYPSIKPSPTQIPAIVRFIHGRDSRARSMNAPARNVVAKVSERDGSPQQA